MIRRLVLAASLAALALPTSAHAEIDPECGRGGKPIHAEFVSPQDGKLTIQTAATGPVSVAGAPTPAGVVLSTTGEITVEVTHGCVDLLRLRVTKDGSPIHLEDFDTACGEATATTDVTIGLDAGEYVFSLTGMGCNGAPIRESSDGHYVGDPPLGI